MHTCGNLDSEEKKYKQINIMSWKDLYFDRKFDKKEDIEMFEKLTKQPIGERIIHLHHYMNKCPKAIEDQDYWQIKKLQIDVYRWNHYNVSIYSRITFDYL